jgi:hypothetical protein
MSSPALADYAQGDVCTVAGKIYSNAESAASPGPGTFICDGANLQYYTSALAGPTRFGIGTASPAAMLDVNGTIRVANGNEACSSTVAGGIRYTSVNTLQYCNSSAWKTVSTAGGSLTAAGANTQVQFNSGGVLGASANFNWDIANGRLGIGNAAPDSLLNVYGSGATLHVSSSDTNVPVLKLTNSGNDGTFDINQFGTAHITAPNTELFSTASGGFVGILGTNGGILNIYNAPANKNGIIKADDNYMYVQGNNTVKGLSLGGVAGNDMVITTTGNVGLGTTSPVDVLSIGTAPTASATHALVNLSNTALAGGNAAGTYMGANPAAYTGDWINYQVAGSSTFKALASGRLYLGTPTSGVEIFPHGGGGASFSPQGAMNIGGASSIFSWDTSEGTWIDAGNYALNYFGLSPVYAPSSATPATAVSMFSLTPAFDPSGAAPTVSGQWIAANIKGTFGSGDEIYNAANPMVGLQIAPTINVGATSTGGATALLVNPTLTSVGSGAPNYIADFQVGSASKMVITSGGNVGVGTTNPQRTLDVVGVSVAGSYGSFPGIRVINNAAITNSFSSVEVTADGVSSTISTDGLGTGGVMGTAGSYMGTVSNNPLAFITNQTARMWIASDGKVGINTAAPATKLDVGGTVRVADGGETCAAGVAGGIRYTSVNTLQYCNSSAWKTLASAGGSVSAAGSTKQVQFNSGGVLGASANFNWDIANGRLGIGTATPQVALDISGTGESVRLSGGAAQDYMTFYNGGAREGYIGTGAGGSGMVLNGATLNLETATVAFSIDAVGQTNTGINYAVAGGSTVYNAAAISPTINQTAGANGITRGLYINPTLTAAADFRAIEVAAGKSLFGGNVGIGTTTPTAPLSVTGSITGSLVDLTPTFTAIGAHGLTITPTDNTAGSGTEQYAVYIDNATNGTTTNDRNGVYVKASGPGNGSSTAFIADGPSVAGFKSVGASTYGFLDYGSQTDFFAYGGAVNGFLGTVAGAKNGLHLYNSGSAITTGHYINLEMDGASAYNDTAILANLGTGSGAFTGNFMDMQVNGASKFKVTSTGATGIANSSPATALDVAGTVKVANGGETCSSTVKGGIRYTSTNVLQYCNSSAWQTLSTGGSVAAVGSTKQVQFNSGGVLGASANFNWDIANSRLGINTATPGADLTVVGSHSYGGDVMTLQNTDSGGYSGITLVNDAGVGNSSLWWGNSSAPFGANALNIGTGSGGAENGINFFISGVNNPAMKIGGAGGVEILSSGGGNVPGEKLDGTWYSAGNAATNKPQLLVEPTGATSTAWSTNGTGLGVNAANGFTGDLLMLQTNGSPVLRVDAANPAVYMNYANENTYLAYAQVSQNLGVSVLYAISPTMSMQGALTTAAGSDIVFGNQNIGPAGTAGVQSLLLLGTNNPALGFDPSSGTGEYDTVDLVQAINQTGTANGVTRGVFIEPTLTSAFDYRALETKAYTQHIYGTVPATLQQVLFNAPTLAAGSAKTVTNAATQIITGAPVAGSNVTITNPYALWIQSGNERVDGNVGATQFCDASMANCFTAATVAAGGAAAGSTKQVQFNSGGVLGASANLNWDIANGRLGLGTATPTAGLHVATNGAASTPAERLDGTWFSGGSATTTKPQFLVEPAGTTSTAWSTAGTGIGVNAPSGFGGYVIDLQTNGTSVFNVNQRGDTSIGWNLNLGSGTIAGPPMSFGASGPIYNQAGSALYSLSASDQAPTANGAMAFMAIANTGGVPRNFQSASGASDFSFLDVGAGDFPSSSLAVNQSGTATGKTRGVYITPVLTSAYDYRALETMAYTDNLMSTSPTGTRQSILFNAPTLAAGSAKTVTNAATQIITGAPVAGSNVTITNPYALWIQSGNERVDGNVGATQFCDASMANCFTAATVAAGGAAAGSTKQVQFNSGGVFGASANLTWDIANNSLGIGTTGAVDHTLKVIGDEFATGNIYSASGFFTADGNITPLWGLRLNGIDTSHPVMINPTANTAVLIGYDNNTLGHPVWTANTVAINGNVGIGTAATAPGEMLFLSGGNLAAATTLAVGSASLPTIAESGAGTRMMWYPKKAAFRAEALDTGGSAFMDDANIGNYSFAFGHNSEASNDSSVAIGYGNIASASDAFALGTNNAASGQYGFVWGYNNTASGSRSTTWGNTSTASGTMSTAWGLSTTAAGTSSTALGQYVLAGDTADTNGMYSMAIGLTNTATANYAKVTGNGSMGIFMQDQHNVVMSASNVMALLGGKMIINPGTGGGVGTVTTPQTALDVRGSIMMGDGGETCASGNFAGAIRYNGGAVQFCNGSSWANVGGAVAAAGSTKQVQFNSGGSLGASANFNWDIVNGRLGIGTATPAYTLDVRPNGGTAGATMFVQDATPATGNTVVLVKSGAGQAGIPFGVQNHDGTYAFDVSYDGSYIGAYNLVLSGGRITGNLAAGNGASLTMWDGGARTYTSGIGQTVDIGDGFSPTSGTGTFSGLQIDETVNQTGGANGISRGLYINPTLTAAADYRAIETSNNTGYALYTAGTASSYFGGNVGIGMTAPPAAPLQIRDTPVNISAFTYRGAAAVLKSATNNGGSTPAAAEPALILSREGITGQAFANFAEFDLSRNSNTTQEPKTRLDIGMNTSAPGDPPGDGVPVVSIFGTQALGSVGVQDVFQISSALQGAVSYPQVATFRLGRYTNPTSFSPNTRLDIGLKTTSDATLSGDATVMTLQGDGKVGIGTTTPTAPLSVTGSITGSLVDLTPTFTAIGAHGLTITPTDNTAGSGTEQYGLYIDNYTNGTTTNDRNGVYVKANGPGNGASTGFTADGAPVAGFKSVGASTYGFIDYGAQTSFFAYGSSVNGFLGTVLGAKDGLSFYNGGSAITTGHYINLFMDGASAYNGTAFLANLGTGAGAFTGNFMDMQVNGASKFKVTSTGATGIANSSPATKLDVAGTVKVADGGETCSSTVKGGIRYTSANVLQYCNSTAWQTLSSGGSTSAAGSTKQVQFNSGGVLGASANLNWDITNSLLGIGTTTPAAKLSINAGANNPINIGQLGSNAAWNIVSLNGGLNDGSVEGLMGGSNANSNVFLSTIAGGYVVLRPNGNQNDANSDGTFSVGPGVAQLIDTSGTGSSFRTTAQTGQYGFYSLASNATDWQIAVKDTEYSGALQFKYHSGVPPMVIQTAGNVGIGTTTPVAKLDVNGSIDLQGVNGLWQDNTNFNTAVGDTALPTTISQAGGGSSGQGVVALGYQALNANTIGRENTGIGYAALHGNVDGALNTALGTAALYSNTSGVTNTALGFDALSSNTNGGENVAVGSNALLGANSARNTALGTASMAATSAGSYNTATGYATLSGNSTGSNNTATGYTALSSNTTGSNNTVLGYQVASTTLATGSNNILIGTSNAIDTPAAGTSDFLNIGNAIFATGMTGTVGSPAGKVGIGTTSPGTALEVNGQVTIDSWAAASATTVCKNGNILSTCSSSLRYKENVKDLDMGLPELMRMRPVSFKWKGRDENDFGFIAEEMHDINPLFNTYEKGQIEGVKYPQLTAVIVNAVKAQQETIESLKAENASLKTELEQTEQTLRDIQSELKRMRPSTGSGHQ